METFRKLKSTWSKIIMGHTNYFLHFVPSYMQLPSPAVFHDKTKRTQQGNLLSLPAPPLETTISTEISDEEEVGVV